jgi:hypothetical protein
MQILTKYGTITNAPIADALLNPAGAFSFFDDYDQTIPSATRNTLTAGTGTTATVGTLDTGVAVAAHGSTASVSAIISHTSATTALTATREIWFETMCSCNYVGAFTNSGSSFVGFTTVAANAATIAAAGTPVATTSVIGFVFAEDGCLKAQVSNATAVATQVNVFGGTTAHALGTTGRTYRLAMRINRNIGVDFYVDGILRTTIAAPTGGLDIVNLHRLSMQTVGGTVTTTLKTLRVDYVAYAYNRT